jgi:hypothetical protein
MKTPNEELMFITAYLALNEQHAKLIEHFPLAEDKAATMQEIRDVLAKMDELHDAYHGVKK